MVGKADLYVRVLTRDFQIASTHHMHEKFAPQCAQHAASATPFAVPNQAYRAWYPFVSHQLAECRWPFSSADAVFSSFQVRCELIDGARWRSPSHGRLITAHISPRSGPSSTFTNPFVGGDSVEHADRGVCPACSRHWSMDRSFNLWMSGPSLHGFATPIDQISCVGISSPHSGAKDFHANRIKEMHLELGDQNEG